MSRQFKIKTKILTRWTKILTESQSAEATLSALLKISVGLLLACQSKSLNNNHSSSSISWLSNPKSNPISLIKWETSTLSSKPKLLNRKTNNRKCNHFRSRTLRTKAHQAGLLESRCMLREDLTMSLLRWPILSRQRFYSLNRLTKPLCLRCSKTRTITFLGTTKLCQRLRASRFRIKMGIQWLKNNWLSKETLHQAQWADTISKICLIELYNSSSSITMEAFTIPWKLALTSKLDSKSKSHDWWLKRREKVIWWTNRRS